MGAGQPAQSVTPRWYYGDTKHLKVKFVRNSDTGVGAVEVVSATGIGLQVGLAVSPGGSVLTSATASTPVDDIFTVDLPLNIAAIATALGTNAQLGMTLEFKTSDGTDTQRYQLPVTIRNQILSGTVADPAPPAVAMSVDQANATFVPFVMPAGAFQIWTEADGTQYKVELLGGTWRTTLLS